MPLELWYKEFRKEALHYWDEQYIGLYLRPIDVFRYWAADIDPIESVFQRFHTLS